MPGKAGTRINFAIAEPVYGAQGTGKTGKVVRQVVQGYIDPMQRVFQSGGQLNNLVYWKRKVISVPREVYTLFTTREYIERLEFIDHTYNRCYSVPMHTAIRHGITYDDGMGERWGIPLECFTVTDEDGKVVRPPTPAPGRHPLTT